MESDSRNIAQKTSDQVVENVRKEKKKRKPAISRATTPSSEDVGHFLENIKLDWSLFWAGIAGEEELKDQDPFETGKLESLSIEQLKQITRALSSDRKKINQRVEQINREIDENTERLESIKLVSGDETSILEEIQKLHDCGLKLSLQLEKVNQQLDRFRAREDELKGLR